MSQRRREQIDAAVSSYEARPNRGASKLTENQVRRIKQLLREGMSAQAVAVETNVSVWSIKRIKDYNAFPDVV
ncbi:MAG TPA: helix-turn-helix domain-containing protein [Pyrinomonadaceae bacterium]|nr:helix-turn-helix domain-containing protein [Pyrinomonadaceae bacterium]